MMTRNINPPKLSRLYFGAALDAARAAVKSSGSLKALPEETVLYEHPGISREQLQEYRTLFGGEVFDGVHRISLPSVLVHIAAFPVQMALMSQDDFPLPLMGMVHLSNAVEHLHPILPEQSLRILARAENLRPHRRGTQLDVTVEIYARQPSTELEDTLLWSSVSTYLSGGTYIAGKPLGKDSVSRREPFDPPKKTALWKLGAEAGRAYAAVSGDYNPIHLSGLSAKLLGMPRAIAHGMYSAGRMLEGREPESAGHHWSIVFEAPVTLPGTVAFAKQQVDEKIQQFVGWNPRKARRHFHGELHLP